MKPPKQPARWLLLSDIHFRTYDLDRTNRTAQWIVSLTQQHAIKRVVVCGDLLTSRSMQPTHVLSACYRFLSQLSDSVPHVNILLGNHDLAYKRDYATSALDALRVGRLAPFVSLHTSISSEEWDGRRVLVLPFREDQNELTQAASSIDARLAGETVAMAHLAINRAITQRHVVRAATGKTASSVTYRGLTGPTAFADLARTFSGHFHNHQTIVQPAKKTYAETDVERLQGSLTYIGSPLQLTWADLCDEQRGVLLFDPDTLQHERVVNPHAVGYTVAEVQHVLHGSIDSDAVNDKHVMLLGELTRSKYVSARDRLLSWGVRSVRNWSPATPLLQPTLFTGLGVTVPASDAQVHRETSSFEKQPASTVELEPLPPIRQLDLAEHVRKYVKALELDPSIESRRSELVHVGQRMMQVSAQTAGEESGSSYLDLLGTRPIPSPRVSTTARRGFVARPRTLIITNFLGIQEKIELDFKRDVQSGLSFVVGANGSGKSTIFEAIVWCQFGRCVRNGLAVGDVVNDVAGKNCSVSLTFENGYTITRYRKDKTFGNRVTVSLHGEPQHQFEKADARSTQEALDELLGIDYDTFVRTVVLGHESATSFLSSSPIQRRELIEAWLGLSKLDDYATVSRQMLREVNSDAAKLDTKLQGLSQTMDHVRKRIVEIDQKLVEIEKDAEDAEEDTGNYQKRDADSTESALVAIQSQIQETRGEVDRLGTRIGCAEVRLAADREQGLLENKRRVAEDGLEHLTSALKGIMGAVLESPLKRQVCQIRLTKTMLAHLRRCLELCIDQMQSSSAGTERLWGLAIERVIRGCLLGLETAMHSLRMVERDISDQSSAQTERQRRHEATIDKLREDIRKVEKELNELQHSAAEADEYTAKNLNISLDQVREAKIEMTPDEAVAITNRFSKVVRRLSELVTRESELRHHQMGQKKGHDEEVERRKKVEQRRLAKQQEMKIFSGIAASERLTLEHLQQKHAALSVHFATLHLARELFAFWEGAFAKRRAGKGTAATSTFRAYILDQSLEELNGLLMHIVGILYEGTRHVSVVSMLQSLFSEKDNTQEIRVMDETLAINPGLSYAKRSGGERKRIDLAVFFALLQLSQARSPHRARYMLVDEVFDSLDATGQAAVVRWCDGLAKQGMDFVLVITHSEHMVQLGLSEDGESGGGRHGLITAKIGSQGRTWFEVGR